MNEAFFFIIDTLFNLYLDGVLLRLWLQSARADFYNPLSQFVVKAHKSVISTDAPYHSKYRQNSTPHL